MSNFDPRVSSALPTVQGLEDLKWYPRPFIVFGRASNQYQSAFGARKKTVRALTGARRLPDYDSARVATPAARRAVRAETSTLTEGTACHASDAATPR